MTNAQKRTTLLAAIVAGTALAAGGCGDRQPTDTMGQKLDRGADKVAKSGETVGQQFDRGADKIASVAERATTKAEAAVDDAAITTKVKSAVLAEPGLKTLEIGVETKNGVVTLSGVVDTPALKERATQITNQVDGVSSVVDNLRIKSPV
jgi:hyperosmotically inducible periplasmic protein